MRLRVQPFDLAEPEEPALRLASLESCRIQALACARLGASPTRKLLRR